MALRQILIPWGRPAGNLLSPYTVADWRDDRIRTVGFPRESAMQFNNAFAADLPDAENAAPVMPGLVPGIHVFKTSRTQ